MDHCLEFDAGKARRALARDVNLFLEEKFVLSWEEVYTTFSSKIEELAQKTNTSPALVLACLVDDVASIRAMEEF